MSSGGMIEDSKSALRVAVLGAGEPSSISQVLRALPETFDYAVIVASPLSLEETRSVSRLPVEAVDGGTALKRGRVYVVPEDHRVRFEQGRLVAETDGHARR